MLLSADENLSLADGGGGVAGFAEVVVGHDVEFFAGADDFRGSFVGQEVDQAAGGDERGGVVFAKPPAPANSSIEVSAISLLLGNG